MTSPLSSPSPAAPAAELPAPVAAQLAALDLHPGRPMLIVDADEVLFYFMRGLEGFLAGRGLYFDWRSYALYGNIRRRDDDGPVPAEDLHPLLQGFFAEATEDLAPVDGAATALAAIAREAEAQIVVLSNLPLPARPARERALARHGMAYPLVANSGPKGPAVASLRQRVGAPAAFIDDIPHNHASVAQLAPSTLRLHYVADPRLAALLGPAPDCHHRVESWEDIRNHVAAMLQGHRGQES
jgi:pyruvate/2-oxoglutarate dehydrogenase complex dihydrolipoamide acyltransferase (E2) component